MPEILLTPEMLTSEAGKIDGFITQLTDTLKAIGSFVESLEGGWHGKAQQAFVNSFKEKEAFYRSFYQEDLPNFSKFLKDYAEQMQATDTESTSLLNF